MSKQSVRIDKWLWAARFFKTRRLATDMVNAGHVQIKGERLKASKMIQVGDQLSIYRNPEQFIINITAIAEKRASASIAQGLYSETEQSLIARAEQKQLRKMHAASAPAPDKRPDKKARRQIIKFIRSEN